MLLYIESKFVFKKLTEFEETQKRKKTKPPSASSLSALLLKKDSDKAAAALKKTTKLSLTTKHGCQLTESIVRYHSDPLMAISIVMKRLRK